MRRAGSDGRPGRSTLFWALLSGLLLNPDTPTWPAPSGWTVPAEADAITSPIPASQDSLGKGAVIFQQRCAVCHGERGRGDGPSSQSLGVRPADLTDRDILAQPDGRLFWKITVGRGPMPNWDVILSDEDRWHVINYLRALSATQ